MSRKGVSNGWAEKPPLSLDERIAQLQVTIARTKSKRLLKEYRTGLIILRWRSWEAGR